MKTYTNKGNYVLIDLVVKGKKFKTSIHRLVARHFCEGYAKHLVVNHIDGNSLNNVYTNLEWVTQKYNIHDTIKRGTFSIKEAHKRAKEVNKIKIRAIDPNSKIVVYNFNSIKEAKKKLGGNPNINRALKEGTKSKGYLWEYE